MSDSRSPEAFEKELADLREEVGRFVLEVLDNGGGKERLISELAKGLTQQLNQTVEFTAAIPPEDLQLIAKLHEELGKFRRAARGPATSAEDSPPDSTVASSTPASAAVGKVRRRSADEDRPSPWTRLRATIRRPQTWAVGGLSLVLVGLIAVLVLYIWPGYLRPTVSTDQSPDTAQVESPVSGDAREARWAKLVTDVEQRADTPATARQALCGAKTGECPSFADRVAKVQTLDPDMRRTATQALLVALADGQGCIRPPETFGSTGAGSAEALKPRAPDLADADWFCLMERLGK